METKRQKKKEETRSRILNVAGEQFAQYGFSVSTTDIAKAAQLSHGSIFLHYRTRDELIDCVIQSFFDQLNQRVYTVVGQKSNIAGLLRTHLAILQENEDLYRHVIMQISGLPPGTKEKMFAYQTTLSYHFEQVLSEEIRQGRIVPVPFHMLFNMWIALVHYYLQNSDMFAPCQSVLERHKETLIQSYMKMIQIP